MSAPAGRERFYFVPLEDTTISTLETTKQELEQFQQMFKLILDDLVALSHTLPDMQGKVSRLMISLTTRRLEPPQPEQHLVPHGALPSITANKDTAGLLDVKTGFR
ncbi:hypothetical protein PT974_02873 [Cladobotryum mycophilum]|uniref:Uncharacterized protein n=1 Tax=Cladobotryum mycophilum TaxID=491253 RepID=A0ABR0SZ96_9HYPO